MVIGIHENVVPWKLSLYTLILLQNVTNEEEVPGDLKRVTFAPTPVMSSYLLAFIVGEFDYVEERDSNGVLVRVYTPPGKAEQGRFALDVSMETDIALGFSRVVDVCKIFPGLGVI